MKGFVENTQEIKLILASLSDVIWSCEVKKPVEITENKYGFSHTDTYFEKNEGGLPLDSKINLEETLSVINVKPLMTLPMGRFERWCKNFDLYQFNSLSHDGTVKMNRCWTHEFELIIRFCIIVMALIEVFIFFDVISVTHVQGLTIYACTGLLVLLNILCSYYKEFVYHTPSKVWPERCDGYVDRGAPIIKKVSFKGLSPKISDKIMSISKTKESLEFIFCASESLIQIGEAKQKPDQDDKGIFLLGVTKVGDRKTVAILAVSIGGIEVI